MADHNYTIVFSVVVVLIPITVTGLAYVRLYLHVRQSRLKVHNHGNNDVQRPEATANAAQPSASSDDQKPSRIGNARDTGIQLGCLNKENNGQEEIQPKDSDLPTKQENAKKLGISPTESLAENRLHPPHGANRNCQTVPCGERSTESAAEKQQKKIGRCARMSMSSTLKLARALFIIYLVFSACWLPFSLLIILDADDTFAKEVHITIVAWAHLHPSVNWLVFYLTHNKFRTAFRKLVRIDTCCS